MLSVKKFVCVPLLLLVSLLAYAEDHVIGMVPPSSNQLQQGFIRIINLSSITGVVTLSGVDDAGSSSQGQITFTLSGHASQQMNSDDIEIGNTGKGLSGAFGDGTGNWRVQISSSLPLKTMGFIRTPEGFMTSIHATSESSAGLEHSVDVFNPASNTNQVSRMRITNLENATSNVEITGTDDNGNSPGTSVTFTMGAQESLELSSVELEGGAAGTSGAIGNGTGKWRLDVSTTRDSTVMSLLEAPGGYLSNLSPSQVGGHQAVGGKKPGNSIALAVSQGDIDRRFL